MQRVASAAANQSGLRVAKCMKGLRLMVKSMWRHHVMNISQQLIRSSEAVDTQPGFAWRTAQKRYRSVIHLVTPIGSKGALHLQACLRGAGVVIPTRAGVKPLRILRQSLRRILLRIDRDRHQVHRVTMAPQLLLQLREDLARERPNRCATRIYEIQHRGAAVIDRLPHGNLPPVGTQQNDVGQCVEGSRHPRRWYRSQMMKGVARVLGIPRKGNGTGCDTAY